MSVKNFFHVFIKLYQNAFYGKNQMYIFNWVYSILLDDNMSKMLKNYFIYTCILKKKKTYKKYIKYTIEFMLHINETDIEYMYLTNKNDPYFFKDDPSYYSKKQFYEVLKNCDIIKKRKKLNQNFY